MKTKSDFRAQDPPASPANQRNTVPAAGTALRVSAVSGATTSTIAPRWRLDEHALHTSGPARWHIDELAIVMRNAEQASASAAERLATGECAGLQAVLIDSLTEEFAAGWVYYYQSAAYLQSKDPRDALVGNAPLFVPRDGSAVVPISYHRPTSESVNAFVCCGDANAMPNAEVELSGWSAGALAVPAIKTIRAFSLLGLFEAKTAVEACLAGEAPRVQTRDVAAARELAAALNEMHFVATITYGAQSRA